MKGRFGLSSPELPGTALRLADPGDLEDLRLWKNANRGSFFYQDIILPEQQRHWFQGYLGRSDDYMFVVLNGGNPVGCMGFRMLGQGADVYNVIRGRPGGSMLDAMRLMCSFVAGSFTRDIGALVLAANPAREWYRRCAFRESKILESHVEVQLDWEAFRPCGFERKELA